MFAEKGFKYFKDVYFDGVPITRKIASEKLRTTLEFLKLFKDENIVVDRFHMTEFVYGALERNYTSSEVEFIDKELALLDAVLILVVPTDKSDLKRASEAHGKDLKIYQATFEAFFKVSTIRKKYICKFDNFDVAIKRLLSVNNAYAPEIYFAAPFFNPPQIEREEWLIKELRHIGFRVFSPRENILLTPNATQEEREKAFQDNIKEINNCDLVFAVTDGKDMGTMWEAGYAYGKNKPVVYYNETLGPEGKFNVMLAQSGCLTILGRDGFSDGEVGGKILDALNGKFTSYAGAIE
jgi:hypothetical protein